MDHFRFLNLGPKMDLKMDSRSEPEKNPEIDLKRDPKINPRKNPKNDPKKNLQKDPLKSPKCCNYNVFGNLGPPFPRFSDILSRLNRVPPQGSV